MLNERVHPVTDVIRDFVPVPVYDIGGRCAK